MSDPDKRGSRTTTIVPGFSLGTPPLRGVFMFVPDVWEGFPEKDLRPDTVYQVVAGGRQDGVRGTDGGKLGGMDDPTARFKDGNVIWSFRTAEWWAGRTVNPEPPVPGLRFLRAS